MTTTTTTKLLVSSIWDGFREPKKKKKIHVESIYMDIMTQ